MDDRVCDVQDASFEGRYGDVITLAGDLLDEDVAELVVIALIELRRWDDACDRCGAWKTVATAQSEAAQRRYAMITAYLAGRRDAFRAAVKDCLLEGEAVATALALTYDMEPADIADLEEYVDPADPHVAVVLQTAHGQPPVVSPDDPDTARTAVVLAFSDEKHGRAAGRLDTLEQQIGETAALTAARSVLQGLPVAKPPHLVLLKHSTN